MRGVRAREAGTADPRPRRPHRGRRALVVVAIVSLWAALTAEVVDDQLSCGSVDPTDPADHSAVSILNDTSATVTVDDCTGGYCQADLSTKLAPGQRLADHAPVPPQERT